ncbi:MAG: hypothetical protein FIB07_04405 [Candidatus Methanoperedens sp.]|nr:hypothetical protein [Candidatus Methanoperedens sp.]
MPDDSEDKYWIWILTFTALIFAIYPMIKDYAEDPAKTIWHMELTLFFAFVLIMVAHLYYKYIKNYQFNIRGFFFSRRN